MKPFTLFVTFLVIVLLPSCKQHEQKPKATVDTTAVPVVVAPVVKQPIDSNVLQVYIDSTGLITANGSIITLAGLDSSLKKLKARSGTVYYTRDNPVGDPPKESGKVIEMVTKQNLPLKFYTDKTFTEIVRMN
ncbi:MAG TPA: hypothetical protein VF487_13760 [Chitinophagaceae bacterium]